MVLRTILALLLVLGLVAPKASVAAAALGLGGAGTVVLCTGDGLVTMTLDAEGRPTRVVASKEACGLLAPVAEVPPHLPAPGLVERRLDAAPARTEPARLSVTTGLPPSRAPPVA